MKLSVKYFFALSFMMAIAVIPFVAGAQGYQPLEPIPGLPTNNVSFPALLTALFRILIVGGAALAVLMMTIGGIRYMTSDVLGEKEHGREQIKNAALGLIFLLAIYLILRTINPQLLNFDLRSLGDVGSQSTNRALQNRAGGSASQAIAAGPLSGGAVATSGSGVGTGGSRVVGGSRLVYQGSDYDTGVGQSYYSDDTTGSRELELQAASASSQPGSSGSGVSRVGSSQFDVPADDRWVAVARDTAFGRFMFDRIDTDTSTTYLSQSECEAKTRSFLFGSNGCVRR